MTDPNKSSIRRFVIMAIVFIVVNVVLLFWARDVIRELVVLPVSYLVYFISIIIDYTPQIFFWIVLLIIGLRIAYLSVSRNKKKDDAELAAFFRPVVEDYSKTTGRVVFWMNKVHLFRSGRGDYYTYTFHEALGRTLLRLLEYRYRMTNRQVEDGLKDGTLDVPEDIREYALKSFEPIEVGRGGSLSVIWDWFSSYIRKLYQSLAGTLGRIFGPGRMNQGQAQAADLDGLPVGNADGVAQRIQPRESQDDPRVRRVLKFMQEELEVLHDDTGL